MALCTKSKLLIQNHLKLETLLYMSHILEMVLLKMWKLQFSLNLKAWKKYLKLLNKNYPLMKIFNSLTSLKWIEINKFTFVSWLWMFSFNRMEDCLELGIKLMPKKLFQFSKKYLESKLNLNWKYISRDLAMFTQAIYHPLEHI